MCPSSSSTRSQSGFSSSLRSQERISSASIGRESPNACLKSAATCSASSSRSGLSSGELIERLRECEQIGQLPGRPDQRGLACAIDPDAAKAELVCRLNVVEERGADVHV